MAEKSLAEKLKALDKISEGINKQAGKVIAGRMSNQDIMDMLKIKFIETPSQNVNEVMGGGFPKKRTTIIAGLPDSGKTSLVLETIALNMKKDPNFVAGWLESESSLEKDYICETFGIDPERFWFAIHEREGAGEQALDRIEAALATGAIDLLCINSLKCLVPSEEFNKSFGQVQVGAQARMNAKMTRKFTSIVEESNTAFVLITHLTTQIGSMSRDPLIVSGGNAILYAAAIILDLRKRSIQDADPIKKEDGIKIGATVKKNHAVPNRNPYLKTEYYAIFGVGIEQYLETLENAINQSILFKAGAYIKDIDSITGDPKILEDGTKLNWCGKDAFRQFCKDNQEYFAELQARVRGEVVQLTVEEINDIEQENAEIEKSIPEDVIADATSKKKKKKK